MRDWRALANCVGMDTSVFFPERGELLLEAQRICAGCEVREECLGEAMRRPDTHGIWGGVSERERRRMRVRRAERPPRLLANAPCGTLAGYRRHLNNDTPACDGCKDANTRFQNPQPEPKVGKEIEWEIRRTARLERIRRMVGS